MGKECAEREGVTAAARAGWLRCRGVVFSGLALVMALTVAASYARAGGALDRFERSHTSDDDDDASSSASSDDDSHSHSYGDDDDDDDDDDDTWGDDDDASSSGSGSSSDTDGKLMVLAGCVIPAFTIPCIMPAYHTGRDPYRREGLYVKPEGELEISFPGVGDPATFTEASVDAIRYAEVELSGFMAMDETALLSHRLQLTVWLGAVHLAANWEHFYERLDSGAVDHLNFYRFHYGFNLLGPYVDGIEIYPRLGVLLLHGEELTPAFDIGGEIRAYPAKPLAIYGSAIASVFELGPVLLDARAQVGVSLDGFEVRAGPRVLYQGDAAEGFWGPAATVLGRF